MVARLVRWPPLFLVMKQLGADACNSFRRVLTCTLPLAQVASCWVETVGHSPPIFASTATESDRDTAYEIIEHFSRLIMWIQRHEDHHLGLADDVEDAAFLHKLHQFDWEAGIDFSAGCVGLRPGKLSSEYETSMLTGLLRRADSPQMVKLHNTRTLPRSPPLFGTREHSSPRSPD